MLAPHLTTDKSTLMNQQEASKFLKETETIHRVAHKKAADYLKAVLNRQPSELEIKQQVLCDVYKVKLINGKITT
jgi:uncharacterized protein YaaW (UPF0174 family)